MSFWSGQTLAVRVPSLISRFNPAKIDCASYRLSMGDEFYITQEEIKTDPKSGIIQTLEENEPFRIPPGQFACLLTEEVVEVPRNALAFISIRFTYKRHGLVNVSGFHVDPGWKGKLIFSVYNAGPADIQLRRGDELFLIWFCDLDAKSADPYFKKDDSPLEHINQSHIPSSGHVYSPMTLIEDTRKNRENLTTINWIGRIFIGLVITLLLASLGFFGMHEYRINRLEDRQMNIPLNTSPSASKDTVLTTKTDEKASPVTKESDPKERPSM